MPKISQTDADEYIRKGGRHCPWCKTGNAYNAGESQEIRDYIAQPVKCDNPACGIKWDDIYTLHDINENAYDETDN
jgi:hypothetical protein